MGIGARTIKTGIAVALSVYICVILEITPPLFAATSAVVCMQQSIGKSLKNAAEQVIVNISAVTIGIILGLTIPILYLSMTVATITVILFCTKVFKAPHLIVMAIISAIFIISSPQDQFMGHAVMRAMAIFIGIGIGNIVNFTLVPPHYQKPLVNKLIELNSFIVPDFINSVHTYLHLNTHTEEEISGKNEEFLTLYEETENLLELFGDETKFTLHRGQVGRKNQQEQLYKDYLNYNRGLWQRSQDILFLTEERRQRRREANQPEISEEFHQLFDMLYQVISDAQRDNQELQRKVKGEQASVYAEPRVWSKLNDLFNKWHEQNPQNNYHMHAVFEVSVITYNIRWFAKESSRLLNFRRK